MKSLRTAFIFAFVLADFLIGFFLFFWPGAWHEFAYPSAVRSTFYLIQQLGLLLVGRGVIGVFSLRFHWRAGMQAVGLMWLIEMPAQVYAILVLHDWSLYGTEFAAVRCMVCVGAGWLFLNRRVRGRRLT